METKHTIKIVLELLQHVLRFVMDREEGQWRTKKHARFIKGLTQLPVTLTVLLLCIALLNGWMYLKNKNITTLFGERSAGGAVSSLL